MIVVGRIYLTVFSVALTNIVWIFHLMTGEMDDSFPIVGDEVPDGSHDVRGASKAGERGARVIEALKKHSRDGSAILGSGLVHFFHPLSEESLFNMCFASPISFC